MRLSLMLILFFNFSVYYSQDSLRNAHYKVRFLVQGKYTTSQFDCYMNYTVSQYYKTSNSSQYSTFKGKINSDYTFSPELKLDFELPLWLKLSCGVSWNRTKFNIQSNQVTYSSINIYDPNTTPASGSSPTVIGSVERYDTVGYNKDAIEMSSFTTFTGLGFSKQCSRFNFDIDYCFSLNRITDAFAVRRIYDNNNTLQKTESYNFFDDRKLLYFVHNFSTSVSYRLYKHIHLKLGFQYSKNVYGLGVDAYEHDTKFENIKSQSFVAGLVFSAL